MGIRNRKGEVSDYCPVCGLKVSISECVLMRLIETDMTYTKRKIHCADYHTDLRRRQSDRTHDYEWAFSGIKKK